MLIKKHGREKCPVLTEKYGFLMATGNHEIREELVKCLESLTIFKCITVN